MSFFSCKKQKSKLKKNHGFSLSFFFF